MTNTIAINVDIPQEFLADVVITAVEGGINYWVDAIEDYVWQEDGQEISHPRASIKPMDEERWRPIGTNTIKIGIHRILNSEVVNPQLRSQIFRAVADANAGDIDAPVADAIVQVALFDDIVYA